MKTKPFKVTLKLNVAAKAQALWGEAYEHNKRREYELALQKYSKAIKLTAKNPKLWVNRGMTKVYLGNLASAKSDFTKAIQINAKQEDAYIHRAILYYDKQQYKLAESDLDKALSINPKNTIALIRQGMTHRALGKIDSALKLYKKALQIDPKNTFSHYNIALAYYHKKNIKKAIEWYNKKLEIDPNDWQCNYNLAGCHFDTKNYSEAVKYYTKAIRINPTFAKTYENRSIAYQEIGKLDLAKADLRIFKRLEKESDPSSVGLKQITYCFIDASNLFYGGVKELGWKIDYEKLLEYLREKYNTEKIFYYAGIETLNFEFDIPSTDDFPIDDLISHLYKKLALEKPNSEKNKLINNYIQRIKFFRKLKEFGYTLKLKPVKTIKNSKGIITKKANCDVDLTFDSMRLRERFAKYILLSGDGDFEILLKYFKEQNKTIIILSNPTKTAYTLRKKFHSEFRNFQEIRKRIEYKNERETLPKSTALSRFSS